MHLEFLKYLTIAQLQNSVDHAIIKSLPYSEKYLCEASLIFEESVSCDDNLVLSLNFQHVYCFISTDDGNIFLFKLIDPIFLSRVAQSV